jgi:DNA polymerase-3 subunit delta'
MIIERDYTDTDKKKICAAIKHGETLEQSDLAELKRSAFIRVDDVRKINEFLAKTSFNDGWRVVIIDSADDMNKNASNALLKILEEPPARTLLLLISHNPGELLPTIRSRCAKLPIHTLDNTTVESLLRRYRPELSSAMVTKLADLSNGSIGKAILYADTDAVEIYDDLCAILCAKKRFSMSKLLDFTAEMAKDTDKFGILQELILKFIKEHMSDCQDPEALYKCWGATNRGFADCVSVNMDKRFMLITLLSDICKVL